MQKIKGVLTDSISVYLMRRKHSLEATSKALKTMEKGGGASKMARTHGNGDDITMRYLVVVLERS